MVELKPMLYSITAKKVVGIFKRVGLDPSPTTLNYLQNYDFFLKFVEKFDTTTSQICKQPAIRLCTKKPALNIGQALLCGLTGGFESPRPFRALPSPVYAVNRYQCRIQLQSYDFFFKHTQKKIIRLP